MDLSLYHTGPEPDAGYPQFWEARAARAAALWASNAKPQAEAEWSALCRPVKTNPPAKPTNAAKAAVNRAAQMQFDGYGVLMDKRRGFDPFRSVPFRSVPFRSVPFTHHRRFKIFLSSLLFVRFFSI